MPGDMLVKLYDLREDWNCIAGQEELGITIRKPFDVENHVLVRWVAKTFGDAWSSEVDKALANRPVSCFIAVKEGLPIGFAVYDSILGYFGPTGVETSCRAKGTGKALLLAALIDMKLKGYGYAIIGQVGPVEFYKKAVGAVEIPDSYPGLYRTRIKRDLTP